MLVLLGILSMRTADLTRAGKDQRVWAYQLGNEPGTGRRGMGSPNATIHGNDFRTLSALLRSVYKGNRNPVRIIGPDVCYRHD